MGSGEAPKLLREARHVPYAPKDLTAAVIAFSEGGLLKHVGDDAVTLVDDYLTNGKTTTHYLRSRNSRNSRTLMPF